MIDDFKYKNMTIGLNYGTIDAPHDDVIYLELDSGNYAGIEGIISLNPSEAEMIAYKILEYVDLFKEGKNDIMKLHEIKELINDERLTKSETADKISKIVNPW